MCLDDRGGRSAMSSVSESTSSWNIVQSERGGSYDDNSRSRSGREGNYSRQNKRECHARKPARNHQTPLIVTFYDGSTACYDDRFDELNEEGNRW